MPKQPNIGFPKPLKKKHVRIIRNQESRTKIIDKLDKVISDRVRDRDNWTCVKCGKKHEVGSRGLTCSHFWNRGKLSTRWDMENCDSACWMPCHSFQMEKMKQGWYREFKLKQLGQKKYDALEMRANTITKYSTADLKIMLLAFEQELL